MRLPTFVRRPLILLATIATLLTGATAAAHADTAAPSSGVMPGYQIGRVLDTAIRADCTKPYFKAEGVVAVNPPHVWKAKLLRRGGDGSYITTFTYRQDAFNSAYKDLICTGNSSYYFYYFGDHKVSRTITLNYYQSGGSWYLAFTSYGKWVNDNWS